MEPPKEIIFVENVKNKKIKIHSLLDKKETTFRHFHFKDCENVDIIVDRKTVKCSFLQCSNLNVHLQEDVIGCIEFIKTHESDIYYSKSVVIPFIQCDMSSKLTFHTPQSEKTPENRVYICTQCMDFRSEWKHSTSCGVKTLILPVSMFIEQLIIDVNHSLSKTFKYTMKQVLKLGTIEEKMIFAPEKKEEF